MFAVSGLQGFAGKRLGIRRDASINDYKADESERRIF